MYIKTFTPRNIKEITTKYPTYNHIIKRIDNNTAYFLISSEDTLTQLDFETTDFNELNLPTYDTKDIEIIKASKDNNIISFDSQGIEAFGGISIGSIQYFNGRIPD